MSGETLFRSAFLIFSLVCIAAGLLNRGPGGRIPLPLGVMGMVSAALYFLNGSVPQGILIATAVVVFVTATVWEFRLIRDLQLHRSRQ